MSFYKEITPEQAKETMDEHPEAIVIDVRSAKEFARGHIPGALCIPDSALSQQAMQRLPDRDACILLYCQSGIRSKKAAATLARLGYTNVSTFGGIQQWPYEVESAPS